MNKTILMGRLTADPITYGGEDGGRMVARYSLAVPRGKGRDGTDLGTDFINCTAFGKRAEFCSRYLTKGMKILVTGQIHADSYTNKEGRKVYTTEIWVDSQEFCESKQKRDDQQPQPQAYAQPSSPQAAPAAAQPPQPPAPAPIQPQAYAQPQPQAASAAPLPDGFTPGDDVLPWDL